MKKWFGPKAKALDLREVRRVLAPALEGQAKPLVGALTLSLLAVLLELARPWPIKIIFDDFLIPKGTPQEDAAIWPYIAAVVLIPTSIGQLALWRTIVSARVGRRVTTRLRSRLFRHLHDLGLTFHWRQRTGDLLIRLMGDVNMVRDLLFASWINIISRGVLIVSVAGTMLYLRWDMALVALGPALALLFALRRSSRKLGETARQQRRKEGDAAALAAESLQQMDVIKAFAAEDDTTRRFRRLSRSGERIGVKAARIGAEVGRLSELLTGISLGALLVVGFHAVRRGQMSPGELLVFVSYARALFKPLRGLSNEGVRLGKASACASRLLDIFRVAPESTAGVPAPAFEGRVTFDHISFSYEDGASPLKDVSFVAPPGALIAITGSNGAGKSTLLALLLRMVTPTGGRILIDDYDVLAYSLTTYRARFAYVPQQIGLFAATIRENILFGNPEASEEALQQALDQALLRDVLDRLPEGLDTELGEGGENLSGGEARRVMLARAAVRDARVLLLDEPLAGIDPSSRPLVSAAIRRIANNRTTFVVTHHELLELDPDLTFEIVDGRARALDRNAQQ